MSSDSTKVCTRCGATKRLADFYWQKNAQMVAGGRYMSHCKECHAGANRSYVAGLDDESRARYYEQMRARQMLRKYGMTLEDYDAMFERQGGVCKICAQPEVALDNNGSGFVKRLSVDHNHVSGEVRGLLCMLCNTRLGYFEKYGLFEALIDYVTEGSPRP